MRELNILKRLFKNINNLAFVVRYLNIKLLLLKNKNKIVYRLQIHTRKLYFLQDIKYYAQVGDFLNETNKRIRFAVCLTSYSFKGEKYNKKTHTKLLQFF